MLPKSSGLKTLARSVARRNRSSIGRQATLDQGIRKRVLSILAQDIQKEMTKLCSLKMSSMLRQCSMENLSRFSWNALAEELKGVTPTLYAFLKGCVDVKRRDKSMRNSSGKVKPNRPSDTSVIGICACILLRHKNTHMNTMQRIVALILHSGHSSKQVNT